MGSDSDPSLQHPHVGSRRVRTRGGRAVRWSSCAILLGRPLDPADLGQLHLGQPSPAAVPAEHERHQATDEARRRPAGAPLLQLAHARLEAHQAVERGLDAGEALAQVGDVAVSA